MGGKDCLVVLFQEVGGGRSCLADRERALLGPGRGDDAGLVWSERSLLPFAAPSEIWHGGIPEMGMDGDGLASVKFKIQSTCTCRI